MNAKEYLALVDARLRADEAIVQAKHGMDNRFGNVCFQVNELGRIDVCSLNDGRHVGYLDEADLQKFVNWIASMYDIRAIQEGASP